MALKKVGFNHYGDPLWSHLKMEGLVGVFYTFRYWSQKAPARKVLIDEPGNNDQSHDDFFKLEDSQNPFEPLKKHIGRRAHFSITVQGASDDERPYTLAMAIYQGIDWESAKENKLGELVIEDNIKFDNGKPQIKGMVIELI